MDILITCVVYILLFSSLAYYIIEEKKRRKRKKDAILDAYFERWVEFVPWTISFLFNTLLTLCYYIRFFGDFSIINYLVTSAVFTILLFIGYCIIRWKVIIVDNKIVKYCIITKKNFEINEISKIKHTFMGEKYYVKDKKIFELSARYHDYSNEFVRHIATLSNCKEMHPKGYVVRDID